MMIRHLIATIIIAAALAACAKEVPVEIKTKIPKSPAACHAKFERGPRMSKFSPARQWTPVQIGAAWAENSVARDAAEMRNERRWAVCRVWIKHVDNRR